MKNVSKVFLVAVIVVLSVALAGTSYAMFILDDAVQQTLDAAK